MKPDDIDHLVGMASRLFSGEAVAAAEAVPGGPVHVEFAKACLADVRRFDGDWCATAGAVSVAAAAYFEATTANVHPAIRTSLLRDVVPYAIGSAWWASIGFPVFNLTLDFFRAVRITDFGDSGENQMYSPYPAYVIRFPEGLKDGVRSGFVYPLPTAEANEINKETGLPRVDGFHLRRFTLAAASDDSSRQAYTQWGEGILYREFLGNNVYQVEDRDPIERKATELLGAEMDPALTQQARRVLGNTLLYINANGGLPAVKKLGPLVPVEREHSEYPRFRIGRAIKLGPKTRSMLDPRNQTRKSWDLEKRFMVRGHWRNQAHGPHTAPHEWDRQTGKCKDCGRPHAWIQPFFKGPDNISEAMQRTLDVD